MTKIIIEIKEEEGEVMDTSCTIDSNSDSTKHEKLVAIFFAKKIHGFMDKIHKGNQGGPLITDH